jgi:NADH-quinone oxidoreductase subunit H
MDLITLVIEATVKSVIIIVVLAGGFAYTTLLERRFLAALQSRVGPNRAGPFGLLQPVADGLKLMFKEDIVPDEADKPLHALAPAITAVPALIVLAVVPVGGTIRLFGRDIALGLTDLNVGVLYILAVTSIAVYGIVLAGWSSGSKYSLLGGLRSSAQMVSYEISLGLSAVVPILLAGSMSLKDIVDFQGEVTWIALLMPPAAIVFMIAVLAEVNRSPFDLPDAEQEITAGYHTEYSGMKFALFFLSEYVKMIAVSTITATLFFGGYRLFGLEEIVPILGPVILFGKVLIFLLGLIWLRATLPRIRYDKLMAFGWKVMLPVALGSVVAAAILSVYVPEIVALWRG